MSIADNVKRVREEIAEAAARSGRSPDEITLVAAAKQNSAGNVREAVLAGVDAIGENRASEFTEKLSQGAYDGVPVHFIGHLQTNKLSRVVGACSLIESADSVRLLEAIDRRAVAMGICQDVLVEVNIGSESSKTGITVRDIPQMLDFASTARGVAIAGLMAIPPYSEDGARMREYFDKMYTLFVDIKSGKYDNVSMRYLSMGMSSSFPEAIRAGSNMVRVGTAIFGGRS